MIVDRINSYLSAEGKLLDAALIEETGKLAAWAFTRQFGIREKREVTAPYFSSIGKCLRQQAYGLLGFEEAGKEIDSRAKMVFFQGDMVELAIVQLAKAVGCNITGTGFEQTSTEWNGMRGRPDGVLDGKYLVEVKSMSSFTFKRFEQGELDESYRYQCNAGMVALGLSKTVIVAQNKDAGVLHEMIIDQDPVIVQDIKTRLATLSAATKENLPPRPYAPDAKGFYPWNCLYCGHWKTCLPTAEKVLVKNSYKLKEAV